MENNNNEIIEEIVINKEEKPKKDKEPKEPKKEKGPKEPKEPKEPKKPKKKKKAKNPPSRRLVEREGKTPKKQAGRARFMAIRNEARKKAGIEPAYTQEQIDAEMEKAN